MSQRQSKQARSQPVPPFWRIGDGGPPAGPFIALAPGAEAPLIALGLPASLKGVAREDVARRQAHDRLGRDAAVLDVRPARLAAGESWTRVAVADRAAVLRWRASLGQGAARCRGILPDYLGLPSAPGLWTVMNDGVGLRARLGPSDGFSAEADVAGHILEQAVRQASATGAMPRAVLWQGSRDQALEARLSDLSIVPTAAELPEAQRPRYLAYGEGALDFARDPRADAVVVEGRIRRMVWPAILLALGAAGWAGATSLATQHDREQTRLIEAETLDAARRDLLGSGPILDLQLQITREIARRRGDQPQVQASLTPLDLLRSASIVLAEAQVQVLAVAMGGGFDGVALDVIVSDFRALDGVISTLEQAGLVARVTRSGIAAEGGVEASVMIEGGTQ